MKAVEFHKLATIAKARVHKQLGAVVATDRQSIASVLRQITSAW